MRNEVRSRGAFASTLSCLLVWEFLCQPHVHSSFRGQLNMWPYWFMSHFQLVFAIVLLKVVYLFHRAYYVHRRLVCSLSLWWSEVRNYTGSLLKDHHVGPERGLIQPTQTWQPRRSITHVDPSSSLRELVRAQGSSAGPTSLCCGPHVTVLPWRRGRSQGRCPAGCWWTGLQDKDTKRAGGRSKRRIYMVNYAFRNTMSKRVGAGENLHSNRIFLDFFSECTQSKASALENFFPYSSSDCFGIYGLRHVNTFKR